MISKEMLKMKRDDAILSIDILVEEILRMMDEPKEMTESRDYWKDRCEELEAEKAQEAK